MLRRPFSRDGFHFAVICALSSAFDAVRDSLDEVWEEQDRNLEKVDGDLNYYTMGCMGNTPVVLLLLPGESDIDAASAAASLRSSYNYLSTVFVVGTCSALPILFDNTEILLGDVIISEFVVRFNFGIQHTDGFKQERSPQYMLARHNKETRSLIKLLKTEHHREKLEDNAFKLLQQLQTKKKETKHQGKYDYPGTAHDKLFDSKYRHKHQDADICDICRACVSNADPVCERALELTCTDLGCSNAYLISRNRLRERAEQVGSMETPALAIHIGGVGSANTTMKSVEARDRISKEQEVIAFEKEGAGVWDEFPSCIIVKGVCDYADSHKPNGWERYAAAAAASTIKALLLNHFKDRQTKGQTQGPVFSVPFAKNDGFVGREVVVKSLIDKLVDQRKDRVALVGMGGVGKTQIALKIAYVMETKESECSILWLPAFSMAGFEQACMDLVEDLNLSNTKGSNARELIKQHLNSEYAGRWLLILDNADSKDVLQGSEGNQGIYAFLPRNRRGQVLITTRCRKVAVDFAKKDVIEIAEMEHKDAKKLLQDSMGSEHLIWEDHAVDELLRLLTYLPLAIAQAVAYMDIFKVPIEEYIRLCRCSQQDMMELMRNGYQDDTLYDESQGAVATTWLISFRQLQKYNTAAAQLLFFIMCIEPQAIPRSILPGIGSEQGKTIAIGTLSSFGFLRERPERGMYDMHNLVHMVMKFWAHEQGKDTTSRADTLTHLVKIFQSDEWDKRDLWRTHLPHVLHVFGAYRETDPISVSDLGYWTGRCLLQDGQTKEAQTVVEKVAGIREMALAQEHPDRLASLRLLATAYQANGQTEEAVMLLEENFKFPKAARPQHHPELLAWQHDLASAYIGNGQFEKAIPLLEDVVNAEATVLDQNDPIRLISQHQLAGAYGGNGRMEEAITLLEHVVKIRAITLPQDRPSRLLSESSLAKAYGANGRIKEAITLMEHVVKIQELTQAPDHPMRLASHDALAELYEDNKQIGEAITQREHIVEGMVTLPQDDPSRLSAQDALADLYEANGQIEEAITQRVRIINDMSTLPRDDLLRLSSQFQLAMLYKVNGQISEAIALLKHVVDTHESKLDQDHIWLFASQYALAGLYEANGQIEEAITLLKYTVETHESTLDQEQALLSYYALEKLFKANGQTDEALAVREYIQDLRDDAE
ncbi:hypothetical protein GGI35DRAFT_487815 [Trichoderma velutinum]